MHTSLRGMPPLYTQVLIAVTCGALLGAIFGLEPYLGGLRNEQLGKLGLFVVTLLKTLAIPLIFFAILDALIRTSIPLRQGGKLLVICLVNVSVAMAIGLAVMNIWQPGLAWLGHVDELLHLVPGTTLSSSALAKVQAGSQSPIEYLASYIPRTIADPFSSNNIIGVVLLALVLGATLRYMHGRSGQAGGAVSVVVGIIERIYGWLVQILGWIILAVPLAVFGVVAQVVGKSGVGVFSVGAFLPESEALTFGVVLSIGGGDERAAFGYVFKAFERHPRADNPTQPPKGSAAPRAQRGPHMAIVSEHERPQYNADYRHRAVQPDHEQDRAARRGDL